MAALLGILDGLTAALFARNPHQLTKLVLATLVIDCVGGWAVAWAFDAHPDTIIPTFLSLFTIEVLAYYPTEIWGVINGLLHIAHKYLHGSYTRPQPIAPMVLGIRGWLDLCGSSYLGRSYHLHTSIIATLRLEGTNTTRARSLSTFRRGAHSIANRRTPPY